MLLDMLLYFLGILIDKNLRSVPGNTVIKLSV